MPVPPLVVQARVDELFELVKKNSEALRNGRWERVKGFLDNRLGREFNQSGVSKNADVAKLVAKGAIRLAKLLFPVVGVVTEAVTMGVDKLIAHFQHSALSAAYDVRSDADVSNEEWTQELRKMQGEYAVEKVAQAVLDARRKVEAAQTEMEKAYGDARDCGTFVYFLIKAEYFYHRVDRLEMYNNMLKLWTQGVDEKLESLQRDCNRARAQTTAQATSIVADFATHLINCKDKPYCLFQPEWMKYFVVPQRPGALVPESPDPRFQRVGQPKGAQRPSLPSFKDPRPR